MILIADSGSSKCSWRLISGNGDSSAIYTSGINPFFRTTTSIYDELVLKLRPFSIVGIERIFFYGSGIINDEKASIIRLALQKLFPDARIKLYSDVVAAARSIFGTSGGIACIIGTGSNACLYDGERVVSGISPLGFILGDESSGAVLGKKLLGDYFKEVMPASLRTRFDIKYRLTREEALQRVYKMEKPNHFLASFAPFLSEEIATEYAQDLVKTSLIEFFERNVTKIAGYHLYPIGFVGSIAFYFKELVLEICSMYQLNCVSILQEPMEGLVKYHMVNNTYPEPNE
ncbi:MAG: ATPase [Prolixibacteraceae bacterium]|nr:ATPase [Prolixibacteraceae bacterium]